MFISKQIKLNFIMIPFAIAGTEVKVTTLGVTES